MPLFGFQTAEPLGGPWLDMTALVVGAIGTLASVAGLVAAVVAAKRATGARAAAQQISRQYGRELARSSATDAAHMLERALGSLREKRDELAEHQINEAQKALMVVAAYAAGFDKDSVPTLGESARELIAVSKQVGGAVAGTTKQLSTSARGRIMDTLRDKREFAERFKVELIARENDGSSNE